jgi:hypothetical protein
LENLDVSKASILASPTPIATAFFTFIIFQEILSIFQLIGSLIVIISIIIIFKSKPKPKEDDFQSSERENTTEWNFFAYFIFSLKLYASSVINY